MLTIAGGIIIAWIVISVIGAWVEVDPDSFVGCLKVVGLLILLAICGLVLLVATNP